MNAQAIHFAATTQAARGHRAYLEAMLADAERRHDAARVAYLTRRLERWITHAEPLVSTVRRFEVTV